MTLLVQALKFLCVSIVWWGFSAVAILLTLLPCGMGPEADCDMGKPAFVWLAIIGAVGGYLAISFLLIRHWKR